MERDYVTEDDDGKAVIDSNGEKIGLITEIKSGTAYVNADPGLADSIRSRLGWGDADSGDYPLDNKRIDSITDDEVRLKETF